MMQVSIQEAQDNLSKLIGLLQSGQEESVILTEDGKDLIKMEKCADEPDGRHVKFGIAKEKTNIPMISMPTMMRLRSCLESLNEAVTPTFDMIFLFSLPHDPSALIFYENQGFFAKIV